MALPTTPIPTDNVNANSDSLDDARVDILFAFETVNSIIDAFGQPAGLATLDALGQIPIEQLNADTILSLLLDVDGAGSGLDADRFDGKDPASYVLTDGSHNLQTTLSTGWLVRRQTTDDDAVARALTIQAVNTPGAVADGYGVEMRAQANNAAGSLVDIGGIAWEWSDIATESRVHFKQRINGNLTTGLRLHHFALEMQQTASPSGDPPTGFWWLYFGPSGLTVQDDAGATTVLGGAGATAHSDLTNPGLTNGDDHPHYFRNDGTHTMTANLPLGAFSILFTDLVGDPAAPSAGTVKLYSKAGELYYRSATDIVGPLGAGGGGGGDHGGLSGLEDDDHPQYVLRQPTDHVVINEDGDDFDFRIEGNTQANLFTLNAGTDSVGFGLDPTTASLGRVQVTSGNGIRGVGIITTDSHGVNVTTATGTGVNVAVSGNGIGFAAARTATSPSSGLLSIVDNSTGALAAYIQQNGSGSAALRVDTATVALAFQVLATSVVVNDNASASMDFRVEGDTLAQLLFIDASADVVNVNGALTTGRLNVTGGGIHAIYALSESANQSSIVAEVAADAVAVIARVSSGTRGSAFAGTSCQDFVAQFVKDLDGEDPIDEFAVGILVANNADTATALQITNFGTGDFLSALSVSGTTLRLPATGGSYWQQLDADMANAPTGMWGLYAREEGFFAVNEAGDVVGPFGSGEGGGIVTSATGIEMRPDHIEFNGSIISGQTSVSFTGAPIPAGAIILRVLVETLINVSGGYMVGVDDAMDLYAVMSGSPGQTNELHAGASAPSAPSGSTTILKMTAGSPGSPGVFGATVADVCRITVFFLRFTMP